MVNIFSWVYINFWFVVYRVDYHVWFFCEMIHVGWLHMDDLRHVFCLSRFMSNNNRINVNMRIGPWINLNCRL